MMSNGSTTYSVFKSERETVDRLALSVRRLIREKEQEFQDGLSQQEKLWSALAKIFINTENSVPITIKTALANRAEHLKLKRAEIDEIKSQLEVLEGEQASFISTIDDLNQVYQSDYDGIESKLKADNKYKEITAKLDEIADLKQPLVDKLERKIEELQTKGKAYEDDVLFMYLRKAGYGTKDYKTGFAIFKRLDAWVADLINYSEASQKFERLLSMPEWISTRISALDEEHSRYSEAYSKLKREYFSVLSDQKKLISIKTNELGKVTSAIRDKHSELVSINNLIHDASQSKDGLLEKINSNFAAILKSTDKRSLSQAVAITATSEDDDIVSRLEMIAVNQNRLMREIDDLTVEYNRHLSASAALKQIEQKFEMSGWNRSSHRFSGIDAHRLAEGISSNAYMVSVVLSMLSRAHIPAPTMNRSSDSLFPSSSSSSSWSSSNSSFGTSSSFGGSDSFSTSDSF